MSSPRIFPTEQRALQAQAAAAAAYGVYTPIVRVGDGWALKYDPHAGPGRVAA